MEGHLPPAAQEKFAEIEELQDEAESVVSRRRTLEDRLEAAEEALEALEDLDGASTVYRRIGTVRVETTADEAGPALEARTEALEARIDELDATEERLREQFENRKRDIKHLLGGPTGGPNSPGTGE